MQKLLFILLLCFWGNTFSQNIDDSDLSKKAKKHYKKEEFAVAEKLYAQLVSNSPSDATYNYNYAVCLLKNGSKKEALKYLQFAKSKSSTNVEIDLYLGMAYQATYNFSQALVHYKKYHAAASKKEATNNNIELLITECKEGVKLLEHYEALTVVSSKTLNRKNFYRGYNLSGSGMKIVVKPKEFYSKEDPVSQKEGDPLLIVQQKKPTTLFFSSAQYSKSKFNTITRDLFLVKMDEDKLWSDLQYLGPLVNTDEDEDFPFLHANGKELYFASKGLGGLGGYDIYKSELDTVTGFWGKPINMGFPINSPYDDVLYIVDEQHQTAYFASNRDNTGDQITVYKTVTNQLEDQYIVINGQFNSKFGQTKKAVFNILNPSGKLIASYQSDPSTGKVFFLLPELQTYKIQVNFETYTATSLLITPSKAVEKVLNLHFILENYRNPTLRILEEEQKEFDPIELYSKIGELNINSSQDPGFNDQNKLPSDGSKYKEALFQYYANNGQADSLKSLAQSFITTSNQSAVMVEKIKNAYELAQQKIEDISSGANSSDEEKNELRELLYFAKRNEDELLKQQQTNPIFKTYVYEIETADLNSSTQSLLNELNRIEREYSKIANAQDSINSLKQERSTLIQNINSNESKILLADSEIEILTDNMKATNSSKNQAELAGKISELEKERKKQKLALAKNQEKFKLNEQQMQQQAFALAVDQKIINSKVSNNEISPAQRERIKNKAAGIIQDENFNIVLDNDNSMAYSEQFNDLEHFFDENYVDDSANDPAKEAGANANKDTSIISLGGSPDVNEDKSVLVDTPTNPTTSDINSGESITFAPNEGVQISATIRYPSSFKIPIDRPLPEGLVFKIQIGAFRNKINPNIFNGLAPLVGESTNLGFTRYTIGVFKTFKAADITKEYVRSLGYQDAFVVGFYNGKRTSIQECINIIEQASSQDQSKYQKRETKELNALRAIGIGENSSVNNSLSQQGKSNTPKGASDDIIYLTVQIGVFKTQKTAAQFNNVGGIFYTIRQDGKYVYNVGKFKDLKAARAKQKEVIALGLNDAFISATLNGVQIDISEALQLMR